MIYAGHEYSNPNSCTTQSVHVSTRTFALQCMSLRLRYAQLCLWCIKHLTSRLTTQLKTETIWVSWTHGQQYSLVTIIGSLGLYEDHNQKSFIHSKAKIWPRQNLQMNTPTQQLFTNHSRLNISTAGFFGVLGTRFGSLEFQIESLESEKLSPGP